MAERVKTRPYNSPRRRAQAAATRREILEAAQRLFERHGYAATTMAGIAHAAQVTPKTVYVTFESKSGVLRALWNMLLRGDVGEAPVGERAWYREVVDEPDPERKLRLMAAASRDVKLRIGPVLQVIHSAARIDRDIDALWGRIQTEFHAHQRAVVQSLADAGTLKAGLDVDRAADILWTINHPHLWELLVGERRWTPEQYEEWCAELALAQLL
jgi:AcrR family transcriptional regulator